MAKELFVGTRKGLFVFEQSADRWKLCRTGFLGVQVPMLMFDARDNLLLASLNHGHFGAKMQRSDDTGRSWEEVETPKYPPQPDDVPDVVDPMRNVAIPWSLELIWTLERSATGTVWCGTIPGGLFRSGDCGQTWQLVRSLWDRPERSHWFGGGYDYPGIHSICLHPSEPHRISLAISCGGVWVSEDDGVDWRCCSNGMRAAYVPPEQALDPNIQDPHRMVQCASQPDTLWVQHHNGIFRTTDSCENWIEVQNVEPSAFGFAVAVHPHDPNTAWFAPAISDEDRYPRDGRFVVTRTVDGGESFETLSAGLPAADAYDLIYRHAMVVDENGSTLAMGSTTGNLWISQDSGESWQCVTTNLPPIFCLRWG